MSFIPGECLKGNKLSLHLFESDSQVHDKPFIISSQYNASGELEKSCMTFGFDMLLDVERESIQNGKDYRYLPTEIVYSAFGKDSKDVRKEYEAVYKSIIRNPSKIKPLNSSSIFYDEGLVITSSEAFAGIPSGRNLASVAHVFPDPIAYNVLSVLDKSNLGVPDRYSPLGRSIIITIPTEGFELVEKTADIHIEIPVKVGLFLTYLKDRKDNPNAVLQLRDEVLTCNFTIRQILQ